MTLPAFSEFQRALSHLPAGDIAEIRKAFDFACKAHAHQTRKDGSPYATHVIGVAQIVAGWGADKDTVVAALLHDVLEDTDVKKSDLLEQFGHNVSLLVEGVTKFTQADFSEASMDRKIETLRKMFDVMRQDIRVALIKLADRVHNIGTITSLPTPERRKRFAKETLDVFDKIAVHLGMRDVRHVYAEHCVPVLYDEKGAEAKRLRDAMCQREHGLTQTIRNDLAAAGSSDMTAIRLQPRNLLVFWQKIEEDGEPVTGDAFAIVATVTDEEACYRLLKSLHTLYHPVSGRFRDYIAAPSDAGYRSLHTRVTMPSGVVTDIRIRTREMDEQAGYGIAGMLFSGHFSALSASRFSWLQRSADLDLRTKDSSSAFWEALESDILRETISVTIDRRRISLPKGSTVLDAAYAAYKSKAGMIHHLTIGGKSVPFSHVLHEEDDIYAAFVSREQVTFEWLKFVMTRYARSLIVDVLKQRDRSEKVSLGRTLLQKELDNYKKGFVHDLTKTQCANVAAHFKREQFDDVAAMIGEGVIRARDVVFLLYPEYTPMFLRRRGTGGKFPFRLHITGAQDKRTDVLAQVDSVVKATSMHITSNRLRIDPRTGVYDIYLTGRSPDRLHFADFIELLEKQEWTSSVTTLIPFRQKMFMMVSLIAAFTVVILDVMLFPLYYRLLPDMPSVLRFFVQVLPLLPIFFANYYILRLLRQYVARMRTDQWFLGMGFLLNVLGLLLVTMQLLFLTEGQQNLFPLMTVFILSLLYLGYRFFQTDAIFSSIEQRKVSPLSAREWRALRRRKIAGYALRLTAVTLWGLQPLYIKYTPANQVPLLPRVCMIWAGIFLVGLVPVLVRKLLSSVGIGKAVRLRLPLRREFFGIVIGYLVFMLAFNVSLQFTTSTNVILLNNFSPVLALFIAVIFWRQSIPYLRDLRHMFWIFFAFVLGSTGGSLLIYYDLEKTATGEVWGDLFALCAMVADTLLAISQIRYMRVAKDSSSLALNLSISSILLVITVPMALLSLRFSGFSALTSWSLLNALGVGVLTGIGQILNYETFRRIDGFIAFLMFNISILITFVIEVFFLGKFTPSWILIISALSIMGSTILAEAINTRCQKKGL